MSRETPARESGVTESFCDVPRLLHPSLPEEEREAFYREDGLIENQFGESPFESLGFEAEIFWPCGNRCIICEMGHGALAFFANVLVVLTLPSRERHDIFLKVHMTATINKAQPVAWAW